MSTTSMDMAPSLRHEHMAAPLGRLEGGMAHGPAAQPGRWRRRAALLGSGV